MVKRFDVYAQDRGPKLASQRGKFSKSDRFPSLLTGYQDDSRLTTSYIWSEVAVQLRKNLYGVVSG